MRSRRIVPMVYGVLLFAASGATDRAAAAGPTVWESASGAEHSAPRFFDSAAIEKLVADGLTLSAGGTYHVWMWGKGPELAVTIGDQRLQVASKDRFGWHRAGEIKIGDGATLPVVVPKNESPDDLTNVPGYIALSTDASFDPKRMPQGGIRTLYDASGFKPSGSKEEWIKRREALRRQILNASGLVPMPPKSDLKPRVYGKQLRDGYSIEKVVLETFPGFYLSGNLYRPAPWVPVQDIAADVKARRDAWEKNRAAEKKPAVLCPHGHWRYGRFEPEVQKRCKQLARMGAVVFAYDMVGYADSKDFGHKFLDPQIDLMGFSLFGLQTWNSIRALDFLTALEDVDTARVACTGASGGGTQTFVLTAIDDRVQVAAPTVMVSQDMQGGCSCENASGFRIGTDNSEIAALFAPKPQIMVCCTGDWTKEFPTEGFPEVQATYRLFDAADRVETDIFDFPHNYNLTTRERVYAFFAKWLFDMDPALSKELPLEAESPETLTTWDADHPRPSDAATAESLKRYLAEVVADQAEQFRPASRESWPAVRRVLSDALEHRLAVAAAGPGPAKARANRPAAPGESVAVQFGRGATPRVRGHMFYPRDGRPAGGTVLVHQDGVAGLVGSDGKPAELVRELTAAGQAVLVFDPYGIGSNRDRFAAAGVSGITHYSCYNAMPAVERVRDIVDALEFARGAIADRPVHLVGLGAMGPASLLARTQAPFVAKTVVDADGFDYRANSAIAADQVLPGIVRLGGLRAAGALIAPGKLYLHNTGDGLDTSWIEAAYRLDGATDKLNVSRDRASLNQVVSAVRD